MTWTYSSTSFVQGNFQRFISASPFVDSERGVDFNETFTAKNPWVFTTQAPISLTSNRNNP